MYFLLKLRSIFPHYFKTAEQKLVRNYFESHKKMSEKKFEFTFTTSSLTARTRMQMAAMMTEAQFVSAIFLKTSMTIWKLQPINHWKEIIFDVKHQKNVVTLLIRQMRSYHRCTRGYPLDNFVRKTLTPFPPPGILASIWATSSPGFSSREHLWIRWRALFKIWIGFGRHTVTVNKRKTPLEIFLFNCSL